MILFYLSYSFPARDIKTKPPRGVCPPHNYQADLNGSSRSWKTAFKYLLFNWDPVLQHDSTGIASRPVQAVERMIGQEGGTIWEKISADRLLKMLAAAMNLLTTETPIISEVSDHDTSSHSSLVKDSSSSTQPTTTVPVQKASEVQPDLSFYSEKIIKEIEKREVSGELYQSTWIYLLDSGGQPHFADVS